MLILRQSIIRVRRTLVRTHSTKVSHEEIRVRFAPSPTGQIHLGGLRTALYNWLFCKHGNEKNEGKLILRIEDTDRNRLVKDAVEKIEKDLGWAGIYFDEGPTNPGKYGPYIQSQRLDIYKEYVDKLIKEGKAYRCFCTPERLDELKKVQKLKGIPTKYDGKCRSLDKAKVDHLLNEKHPNVVRFKSSKDQQIKTHNDTVYGIVQLLPPTDFILIKSDNYPTYHLANVVDDRLMKITHVMRGEEWLNSLSKHIHLYKAFDWIPPQFIHLPLIKNQKGEKLSKRENAATLEWFKEMGYLPQALLNYVALLGWSPTTVNKEIMDINDMKEEFTLSNINKSNPMVFLDKLNWLNKNHLIKLIENDSTRDKIVSDLLPKIIKKYKSDVPEGHRLSSNHLHKVLKAMKGRIHLTNEILDLNYFFKDLDYESIMKDATAPLYQICAIDKDLIELINKTLNNHLEKLHITNDYLTITETQSLLNGIYQELNYINKNKVMKGIRLIISNQKMGPPLIDLISLIGSKSIIQSTNTLGAILNMLD